MSFIAFFFKSRTQSGSWITFRYYLIFFYLSSQIIPFISFSCVIELARTFNRVLKRHDERKHPCLVPDIRGKTSSFSPLNTMLAVGFYRCSSSDWGSHPLFLVYGEFLSWMDVGFCQMLFLQLFIWSCGFFPLQHVDGGWITIIYFQMLNQSHGPGINPAWSWCIMIFIHCWIC